MIINSSFNTLTIIDIDNIIKIRNLDEFNILKHRIFNGHRILIKYDENNSINETYDNEIFNLTFNGKTSQSSKYNEIARIINLINIDKDLTHLQEFLILENISVINFNFLEKALKPFYKRIKFDDSSLIIDNMYKIKKDASAYQILENNQESYLCIVVKTCPEIEILNDYGKIKIDSRTREILFKAFFLLMPNLKDKIFYNQLTEKNKKFYKAQK
jgi:hypothetical protein